MLAGDTLGGAAFQAAADNREHAFRAELAKQRAGR
jgi:hypothetical protein